MNRKERRAAQKQGKGAPGQALGAPGDSLFASAVQQFRAGRIDEAERLCRDVLMFDPDHFDSLHLLGFIAHQSGHDGAADLLRRALAINARSPECHFHLALALHRNGRLDDAAAHLTQAGILRRDYTAAHMILGNIRMQQAKFDAAQACYQRALALEPGSADAHVNLGNAFMRQDKAAEAESHYRKALALRPAHAGAATNLGLVLLSLGKHAESIECFRSITAANPGAGEAHRHLGDALLRDGQLAEAAASYRRALELQPNSVEAHYGLANTLMQQGELAGAVEEYRRALALKPDYAEVCNNLGIALAAQGDVAEAEVQYRRALALRTDLVDVYRNLGRVLLAQGNAVEALELARRSLGVQESAEAKAFFVECAKRLSPAPAGAELRALVTRALIEGWSRPGELAALATELFKSSEHGHACVARAVAAWPRRPPALELFGPDGLASVAADRLLGALLVRAPTRDIELERFLTAARSALLDAAIESDANARAPDPLGFFCALAQQCFINEYVFAVAEEELRRAAQLREKLADALQSGASVPASWLVAAAAYAPLHALAGAASLIERGWPEPIAGLLRQQVQEPLEEQKLRQTMPVLTPIENDVSLAVRRQYEEMPYPRWVKTAPAGKPTRIDWHLRNRFPLAPIRSLVRRGGLDILVAGCGTGQHSIETAQRYAGAKVLAVDLSQTSLGYAKRKTQALGLSNVDYAQADILALGSIGRSFDLIEASGVLHHVDDPATGWRILLSLLRPGGFMHLGLYSALARKDILTARAFIAEKGYRRSADDIRRCRQDIMALAPGTPLRNVTKFSDFFTTSECRDLLFHVQEHQLSIPEIERFLRDNDLVFLGFVSDVDRDYRKQFPEDRAMLDLDKWHLFETENPATFANMYQFWVQKPAA